MLAWQKAAKGKRGKLTTASFEADLAENLLQLQQDLRRGNYKPGPYTHFSIHEPKRRTISAAPFYDRVVHHALCNIIEPLFESMFIADSYANRKAKGGHRAVDRFQEFSQRYKYVLRMDIVQHFHAIDHRILLGILVQKIQDEKIIGLIKSILASGDCVRVRSKVSYFPGDDLLAACRPRGLPIGNLTSQLWSNCYLHPFDQFVKRELACRAYLRYVDDFALFSDSKATLWRWKKQINQRLQRFRLKVHQPQAQVCPVSQGVPWLGFVIYPDYRRLKRRKVVYASRRLGAQFDAWQAEKISFAEFDASVQGWINHVRYADSWGLRKHMLKQFKW